MSVSLDGQCLCGTVKVSVTVPEPVVEACHCTMCVRWGGGAYLSTRSAESHSIEGEDHVIAYPSSDWAERGFCAKCGTHLYFRYLPADRISFTAGLFDGASAFEIEEEIFVDEKPGYYDFAGDRPRLTAAEVVAKHKPGG